MGFVNEEGEDVGGLEGVLRDAFPETYDRNMRRDRPAAGQQPERGKTAIRGISFRDLRDCFVRACCQSAGGGISEAGDRLYRESERGEAAEICEQDVYDLPWDQMDPIAVAQNLGCQIEKMMGIYPNTNHHQERRE